MVASTLQDLQNELEAAKLAKDAAWEERSVADKRWTDLLHTVNALEAAVKYFESKQPATVTN